MGPARRIRAFVAYATAVRNPVQALTSEPGGHYSTVSRGREGAADRSMPGFPALRCIREPFETERRRAPTVRGVHPLPEFPPVSA